VTLKRKRRKKKKIFNIESMFHININIAHESFGDPKFTALAHATQNATKLCTFNCL